MNSRNMLLAGLLFVAPFSMMLAEDTNPSTTTTSTDNKPGMLSKIGNLMIAPFAFAFATAPDYVAKNTLGKIAAIEYLKGGKVASVIGNQYVGRATVLAATAYTLYKLNKMYNNSQDDVDANNEDFFESN